MFYFYLNEFSNTILFILYLLILLIINRKKKKDVLHLFILSTLGIYILGVINVVLFPIPFNLSGAMRQSLEHRNNFIPFASIVELVKLLKLQGTFYGLSPVIEQIVLNIVLGIPFGFLFPLTLKKRINYKKMFIYGLVFSIMLESSQYIIGLFLNFNYRSVDIDDVIYNLSGSIIGFIGLKVFIKQFIHIFDESSLNIINRLKLYLKAIL